MTVHRTGEFAAAPSGTVDQAPWRVERLGRYALLALLGKGGMSTLHLAVASGLGDFRKLVGLKELRPDLARDPSFVEMFLAEAKVAARMNHPNIVQTLEAEQSGDRYYLAMEFLDGQPFSEVLRLSEAEPRIPLQLRLQMLCDVLAGLHYAHELSDFGERPLEIVHRDISPHNVFVTYHGQVKVLDFGIAKAVDIEPNTDAGVFKGRFAYASPEQVMCRAVDRRADVFAVGVMLWETIAGRRFARGPVTDVAIQMRLAGTEPRIAEVVPAVPLELAAICDRAIHVDPAQRYTTAEVFRSDLAHYVLGHGELLQTEQIGALMRTKFATEYATMHRSIQAWSKKLLELEDLSGSVIRSLTALAVQPAEGEHTAVGDLTAWIERSRTDNPSAEPAREVSWFHPKRAWRWFAPALAFVALVALLVTNHVWLRPKPAALPQRSETAARALAPGPASAPSSAPAMPPSWTQTPVDPQSSASSTRNPEDTAQRAHVRGGGRRDSRRAGNDVSVPRTSTARNRAPASDDEHALMPGPDASAADSVRPASTRPWGIGQDLRARQTQRPPRRIDVENPFR